MLIGLFLFCWGCSTFIPKFLPNADRIGSDREHYRLAKKCSSGELEVLFYVKLPTADPETDLFQKNAMTETVLKKLDIPIKIELPVTPTWYHEIETDATTGKKIFHTFGSDIFSRRHQCRGFGCYRPRSPRTCQKKYAAGKRYSYSGPRI